MAKILPCPLRGLAVPWPKRMRHGVLLPDAEYDIDA